MKKLLFALLLLSTPAYADFNHDAQYIDNWTNKTEIMPGQLQSIIDYGARTDGQPVYFGHAVLGTITSNTGWIIFYYTYDGSGNMLTKQTAYGAWTNRTALAYA